MKEIILEKHIRVYEDAVTSEWCDKLIDKYEETQESLKGHALFRESVEEIEVPYEGELWDQVNEEIAESSQRALNLYLRDYMVFEYEYEYLGTKMLYYPPLGFSPMHYDDELLSNTGENIGHARPITVVVFLNDDFEGGELYFQDQGVVYKPKKGSIIIFPASYMYPHSTNPTCGKVRYSLLPFFVKSGLNVKKDKSKKKDETNGRYRREFRRARG